MTSSFAGINTLSRSLYNQSIVQNTTASNLAKTYRDSDGYVMVSRERANFTTLSGLTVFANGGFTQVGQGQALQQVTRMRSFYLDYQIQKQSMTFGRAEVLSDTLKQVQDILNGTAGTVDSLLTDLAGAFTALAADPLNLALRNDVVAAGVAFAENSRDQFSQLETLQYTLNKQVDGVVGEINGFLQELSSINTQLLSSLAPQTNNLLDARDYALDRLARLINFTVSYGNKGTVSVSMNGLSLVDAGGAASFSTSAINTHNPVLSDVVYRSVQGTQLDITAQVRGGQLAGLLEARDTTVEALKSDLDHYVTSVMTVANILHRSGYGSDGVSTGVNFFTGVSARDINMNTSITTDSNRVLLAASSRYGNTANSQVATFLGNLPNLLTDDRVESSQPMNSGMGRIDPTVAMNSTANTGLNGNTTSSNSTNFSTTPSAGGLFTVNSSPNLTYLSSQSVYDMLDTINAADPTVQAVFSYRDQKIYMVSNNTISIKSVTGNIFGFAFLRNRVSSTIRMNNGFTEQDLKISATTPMNTAFNTQAFKVTPSTSGSFQVNIYGTTTQTMTFAWDNKQTLNDIITNVQTSIQTSLGRPLFTFSFDNLSQTLTISDTTPVSITDLTGNFTTFTGMNGSPRIGNMGAGLAEMATADYTASKQLTDQARASLDQLNNAQANIAAISYSGTSGGTTVTEAGVPYQTEVAESVKSMIAYNASLQAMAIMQKMLSDLVSVLSGSGSSAGITLGQNS
jgi:flagellar hook-associated protein FlgK